MGAGMGNPVESRMGFIGEALSGIGIGNADAGLSETFQLGAAWRTQGPNALQVHVHS